MDAHQPVWHCPLCILLATRSDFWSLLATCIAPFLSLTQVSAVSAAISASLIPITLHCM